MQGILLSCWFFILFIIYYLLIILLQIIYYLLFINYSSPNAPLVKASAQTKAPSRTISGTLIALGP